MRKLGDEDSTKKPLADHVRTIAFFAVAAGLVYNAVVAEKQQYWSEYSCTAQNRIHSEINKRGVILRKFLESAAEVRHESALVQLDVGLKDEATINLRVARQWEAWAADIDTLELHRCEEILAEANGS